MIIFDKALWKGFLSVPYDSSYDLKEFTVTPKVSKSVIASAPPYSMAQVGDGEILLPYFFGRQYCKTIVDVRPTPKFYFLPWKGVFRDSQKEAVDRTMSLLLRDNGVFLHAPPGSGKTVMALALACKLCMWPVVIMVDSLFLMKQWIERIIQFVDPKAKISLCAPKNIRNRLKKSYPSVLDTPGDFIIVSVQSMLNADFKIDTGLLIVDECHVVSAPQFCKTIYHFPFYKSIGISATTELASGTERVFRSFLGSSIVNVSPPVNKAKIMFLDGGKNFPDGWEQAFTNIFCKKQMKVKCFYDCVSCKDSTSSNANQKCMFTGTLSKHTVNYTGMLRALTNADPWFKACVEVILHFYNEDRSILAFSHHVDFLFKLKEEMKERCVKSYGVFAGHATTKEGAMFEDKATKAKLTLTTFKKCGKGVDLPWKDTIILLTPPSHYELEQLIGRIERIYEGKKSPLVVHILNLKNSMFKAQYYQYLNFYKRRRYYVQQAFEREESEEKVEHNRRTTQQSWGDGQFLGIRNKGGETRS